MIICAAYSTFLSAYYAAFGIPFGTYHIYIYMVVEILFFFDIIFNFF
jgi:hypothetical protein